jgi:hypothetical protein
LAVVVVNVGHNKSEPSLAMNPKPPPNLPATATMCTGPTHVRPGDGVVVWRAPPEGATRTWAVVYANVAGTVHTAHVAFAEVGQTVRRLEKWAAKKRPFAIIARAVTAATPGNPVDAFFGDFLPEPVQRLAAAIAMEPRPKAVHPRDEARWYAARFNDVVLPRARKITVAADLAALCAVLTNNTATVTVTKTDSATAAPTECTVAPPTGASAWHAVWIRFARRCCHRVLVAGKFVITAPVAPLLVEHILWHVAVALRETVHEWVPPEHPRRIARTLPAASRAYGSSATNQHPQVDRIVEEFMKMHGPDGVPPPLKAKKMRDFAVRIVRSGGGPRSDRSVPTCDDAAVAEPTSRTCLHCPAGAAETCRPVYGETPIGVAMRTKTVPPCTIRTGGWSDAVRRLIANVLAAVVLGRESGTSPTQAPRQ